MQQLIRLYKDELQEVKENLSEAVKLYAITKGLSYEEIIQILDKLEHSKDIDGKSIISDLDYTYNEMLDNADPKPPKPDTFPGVGSKSSKTTLVVYDYFLWYTNPVTGKRITKGVVAHLNSKKTILKVCGICKKMQKSGDIINEAIGDILPGKRFERAELTRPELIQVLNKLQALGLLV
jgi:tetrahydromethanopterin S-methyltransferase subunit B